MGQSWTRWRNMKSWPDWERTSNPELWAYYARQIMEPGWAGRLSPSQVRYVRGVLTQEVKSPYFKKASYVQRRWGFRGEPATITEAAIQEVAVRGDPGNPDHNAELVRRANSGAAEQATQLELWA